MIRNERHGCLMKVVCLLILILVPTQLSAKEKLVLFINGEPYERDYPTSVLEYKNLVDQLADMYNNLDKKFLEYSKDDIDYLNKLNSELSVLKTTNEMLVDKLKALEKDFNNYKKEVDKMNKRKTKLTAYISSGPSFTKTGIGTTADLLLEYRVFSNFHLGLNAGIDVYNNNVTSGNVGISIGYSIF